MKHKDKSFSERPLITIVILLISFTISTAPAQTVPQIAEKALAATVFIEMQDNNGKTLGFGSGFFVRQNLIATNYHVIAGATYGTAKLVGKNTKYNIEGVTATDEKNDLAILKVTADGVKPLLLGKSDSVKIGETVYVAGNPLGLEGTFSDGIISSRRDKYTKERLQMTAPISPGSSGGPVMNSNGVVIGVSVSVHRALDAQNLNFAIPSRYLHNLLAKSNSAKPLGQGNRSISAETYFRWGNVKFDLGDYKGAIADYTQAILLNLDDAHAYYNRGIAKAKLKQYFAAIVDYDTAIRLKPDYADAYYNRGHAKDDMGQHFAAIEDYDIAIRLKPDYADAYNNRGIAKRNLGKYFAAIADYDVAIRLKPNDADAYINRGNAKAYLEQFFAAIADFDTAIRLSPDDAVAYYNRGQVKVELEQYPAAISDFDASIHLKPNDAFIYYFRGYAKYKLGHTWEAKQDFRTALKLAEKTGDTESRSTIEELLRLLE